MKPATFFRLHLAALLLAVAAALLPLAVFPGLLDPRTSQRFALQVALFAFAAAAALFALRSRREAIALAPADVVVIALGAWIATTSALSQTPRSSLLECLPLAASFTAWFLFSRHASGAAGFRLVASGMVAAAVLVAFAGIAQSKGIDVLSYAQGEREGKMQILSLLGNPNYVASFLAPAAILCGALAASCSRWPFRIAACLPILPILHCLAIAGGRAGLLGLVGGAAVVLVGWMLVAARRRHVSRAKLAIAAAAFVLVSAAGTALAGRALGSELRERIFSSEGLYVRLLPWHAASRLVADRPIMGIGQGRYFAEGREALYGFLKSEADADLYLVEMRIGRGGAADHLHNDFLQILVEAGLPGIFMFFAIAFLAFDALMRRVRTHADEPPLVPLCLIGAMVCHGIDGFFGFPLRLPASSLLFWFIVATANREPRPLLRIPGGFPRIAIALLACIAAAAAAHLSVRQALGVRTRVGIAQAKDVLAGNPQNQRIFEDAWRLAPFIDPQPYALVNTHIERGNLERAATLLAEMEEHLFMGGVGYQQMATVAWSLGRRDEALAFLDRATTLDPFNPDVLEYAAAVCIDRGLPEDAEKHLRRATRQVPARPNSHFMLGTISEGRGDFAEAAARYERALRSLNGYGGTLLFRREDAAARLAETRRRSAN